MSVGWRGSECPWDGGSIPRYRQLQDNSLSLCGHLITLSSKEHSFETALRVMLPHCVKTFYHSLNCTDEESQRAFQIQLCQESLGKIEAVLNIKTEQTTSVIHSHYSRLLGYL